MIARYARENERLIPTQDDDFFTEPGVENTAGVLFQRDHALSTREVGDAVHEMARYLDRSDVVLEHVTASWLWDRATAPRSRDRKRN